MPTSPGSEVTWNYCFSFGPGTDLSNWLLWQVKRDPGQLHFDMTKERVHRAPAAKDLSVKFSASHIEDKAWLEQSSWLTDSFSKDVPSTYYVGWALVPLGIQQWTGKLDWVQGSRSPTMLPQLCPYDPGLPVSRVPDLLNRGFSPLLHSTHPALHSKHSSESTTSKFSQLPRELWSASCFHGMYQAQPLFSIPARPPSQATPLVKLSSVWNSWLCHSTLNSKEHKEAWAHDGDIIICITLSLVLSKVILHKQEACI
jgi:hypothetical protein